MAVRANRSSMCESVGCGYKYSIELKSVGNCYIGCVVPWSRVRLLAAMFG